MKLKMVLFHYAPVLFIFSILFNHTFAQQQGSREDVTIIKIKENFYRIECINDFTPKKKQRNVFGDGKASNKIVRILKDFL